MSPSGIAVTIDPKSETAKNPAACQTHAIRIQFASAEALKKAGIQLEPVVERPMTAYVKANGEIAYNQTRLARLSTRTPGIIWRVEAELGQKVKRGDVLALVDAVEVGRAKADLLQALAAVDVNLVLPYVPEDGETEEVEAFEATLR